MQRTLMIATPAAAFLALAGQLLAGGFYLELGNPEASAEARKNNAVVTIRAFGCHDPATAQVTATAIGMVNGHRQSIPLTLAKLPGVGMFALSQQWPKEGKWVLELVGKNGEQFTNSLVAVGPNGVDRYHAKANLKKFSDRDIDEMLEE